MWAATNYTFVVPRLSFLPLMRLFLGFDATIGILLPLLAGICGLDLVVFYQSVLVKRAGCCEAWVGSWPRGGVPGSWRRVGRGNKFVLLDMTEEPEAKKLTVYNTNEI